MTRKEQLALIIDALIGKTTYAKGVLYGYSAGYKQKLSVEGGVKKQRNQQVKLLLLTLVDGAVQYENADETYLSQADDSPIATFGFPAQGVVGVDGDRMIDFFQ